MEKAMMTRKGQLVIPVILRRKVGIKGGTQVFLEEKNGDIVLHPATPEFYRRTCGILKGGGLVKTLMESRQKEKELEEKKIAKRQSAG